MITEEIIECTIEISKGLSKLACGLPSTEVCSLSDMQDCSNVPAGIGLCSRKGVD